MSAHTEQTRLNAPGEAMAALYFLPGQYLFKQIETGGRETTKALSTAQVSLAFREYRTDTGWLDRRILRYREEPAGNSILSCEPARIKRIRLETNAGDLREIAVPLPTLVLLGRAKDYYLWATDSREVSEKSLLAAAPLPNIGGNLGGKICFGNNEVPECRADNADAVWNLIFNTPFNNHQREGKCKSYRRDVRSLLFKLGAEQASRFPKSELVKSDVSIERVWEHITEDKPLRRF